MNLLIDENMPRSLAEELTVLGYNVQDVRDIGLIGHSDEEVFEVAAATDSVVITRDRGFIYERNWPTDFSAGVIFVNLPDDATTQLINAKIKNLLTQRLPVSLLGAVTFLEPQRALSHVLRRRPKLSPETQKQTDETGDDDEAFNAQLDETRTD